MTKIACWGVEVTGRSQLNCMMGTMYSDHAHFHEPQLSAKSECIKVHSYVMLFQQNAWSVMYMVCQKFPVYFEALYLSQFLQ